MCLYADSEISRPICPRTYYKVVTEKTRLPFFYPGSGISYKKGAVVKGYEEHRESYWSSNWKWIRNREYVGGNFGVPVIRDGAIHVFTDLREAEALLCMANTQPSFLSLWVEQHRVFGEFGELPKFELISVKCRPEHWLAYGTQQDAAYTEVEVLD